MAENGNAVLEDTGEYRQRVRSLERQYDSLSTQIGNINTKIDEKFSALQGTINLQGRTPWGNIIAACGVTFGILSGMIAMLTSPINSAIFELKNGLKETRLEIASNIADGRKERSLVLSDMTKSFNQDIRDIREVLVPRLEHQSHNATLAAQLSDLSRRITEVRDDYKDIFSARDIIQKLMNDVSILQKEIREKN